MLNDNQIMKALNNGDIHILYYFYRGEHGELLNYGEEKNFNDINEFKDYLYSDRLKVTLGPVVKKLSNKKVSRKYRFNAFYDCYDMRKSSNKYTIKPGESIVILTNERIELDGKHSVLILPRVSLSEVGIIVTSAYIDPYYSGLLRLNVENNSQSPYELKALETIAQCFFFELPDQVNLEYEKNFSNKSVFIGQNWKALLTEDRLPFPVKKNKKYVNPFFYNVKNVFSIIYNFLNKNAMFAALISALLLGMAGYVSFNNYKENTEKIIENYQSKSAEIIIPPGDKIGEKEVNIDINKDDIITILCNRNDIKYEIFSGNQPNKCNIVFTYELKSTQTNKTEIDFTYTIVKKV